MSETRAGSGGGVIGWIDDRFPLTKMWREHMGDYYAPKNFNFWYFFGSLALLVLVIQLISGIWLTMNYIPAGDRAFESVEYIMRDVDYGWLMRYIHSTGASAFFVVVYLHMFRALMYGSYQKPRELLWIFGVLIYVVLMAEAFFGYILPWGQMSYWGAQVIISLFGAIPVIGPELAMFVRGDFVISEITLNRLFALHVAALPLALIFLIVAHILALHEVGSNNPDGIEIKEKKGPDGKPLDGIRFHPYYTVKDLAGYAGFLILFSVVVFFMPEFFGYFLKPPNFVEANPTVTPEHIPPVWYFGAYYAMLRGIPDTFGGVMVMGAAIVILFFLPWLDRGRVRSIRYRGLSFKIALGLFAAAFVLLTWLGTEPAGSWNIILSRVGTLIYFGYFIFLFVYTFFNLEQTKPVPERVTMK
ncbi:ubiquinol-cytochrome c reductase cytochrome b subunit [Natronocella acetinitrilica]|uniref:Cytochrome b n=1 Tax=Natronocella acetinitrilica TaxID=414046 RepID=A0AAE3G3V9_9GAMM|nr:cytochrome b N-terminal domain-containing protein [Natronocella acetinitrilica]MCP1673873.1 ubiquinol-cytochrome c reductase cytochrome b subunit [Natronocella acetinitrilica]